MRKITLEQLTDKVQELIVKHNALAKSVVDLLEAVEAINEAVFSTGDKPKNLDS
jgi:hypothetical protein